MREDMAKVIVERPRRGASYGMRKGRLQPVDHLPRQKGLHRDAVEHHGEKTLNENLSPLVRYLERQVGRPWDKVYSEICRHLKATSTVQQHVRDHIGDYVEVRGAARPHWYRRDLYVDPADGILKRVRVRRRADKKPEQPSLFTIGPFVEFRQLRGIWFEVRLATLPCAEYRAVSRTIEQPQHRYGPSGRVRKVEVVVRQLVTPAVVDVVTGAPVNAGPDIDEASAWDAFRKQNPRLIYAAGKRQLSRAELRRHGLQNDVDWRPAGPGFRSPAYTAEIIHPL